MDVAVTTVYCGHKVSSLRFVERAEGFLVGSSEVGSRRPHPARIVQLPLSLFHSRCSAASASLPAPARFSKRHPRPTLLPVLTMSLPAALRPRHPTAPGHRPKRPSGTAT